MHGSIMPQSQFSNIHNANIAQSNYIPNYQFKRWFKYVILVNYEIKLYFKLNHVFF